jgi:hypothetical protein
MKINKILKNRELTTISIFIWIVFDITIRIFIEFFTLEKQSPYGVFNFNYCFFSAENFNITLYYALFYVENISYFLILFMLLTSLVYFMSNYTISYQKIIKEKTVDIFTIIKTSLVFYPLIIIPPLYDYFINHRHYGYDYGKIENFWTAVFTLSWYGYDGKGISLLITIGVLSTSGYVYYQTKSIIKSLITFILTDLIIMFISVPAFFYGFEKANFLNPMFLSYYYLIPLFISSLIFLNFFTNINNILKYVVKSLPLWFLGTIILHLSKYSFLDNFNDITNIWLELFSGFFIYIIFLYFILFFKLIGSKKFNYFNIPMLFYIFLFIIYFDISIMFNSLGLIALWSLLTAIYNFKIINNIKY